MRNTLVLPLLIALFATFAFSPLSGQTLFTKITDTTNPVVTFSNTAADYKGAVWIDLNHDNWPDLFVSQRFLFRNDQNGNFTRLPDLDAAVLGQGAAGSSWGDLNNDGHPDYITAGLVSGMFYNNGDNTFASQTALLPDFTAYSAWDCALADADNNGRLDAVFVHACCTFHTTGPFPCRFYLQNADGSFAKQTGLEFTDENAAYTIPIWADYDLDGDMDLFIGSGPAGTAKPDYNYRNMLKETGTFSLKRLTTFPFMEPQDGQTYNFIDFDNDGDLDICLTNYNGANTRFYRNDSGNYVSVNTGFTDQDVALANVWGDVDNDGDLDVLITKDQNAAVQVFRNNGSGGFLPGKVAGTANGNACGLALADYDNDGDLDFYTNGRTTARTLFRNDTLTNNRHWLQLTLEGTQSNRSAIGATVRAKALIGGKSVWQIRQVLAHNSFQGQSDLRQHFGLGNATMVDSLEIRWPSGLIERFGATMASAFYKAVEGQGIKIVSAANEPIERGSILLSPNPVTETFLIKSETPIEQVDVFDSAGRVVATTFQNNGKNARVQWSNDREAGTYFVRIRLQSGEVVTKQIVKL